MLKLYHITDCPNCKKIIDILREMYGELLFNQCVEIINIDTIEEKEKNIIKNVAIKNAIKTYPILIINNEVVDNTLLANNHVIKRDGSYVDFCLDNIINAITAAMNETVRGVDQDLARKIAVDIALTFKNPTIEEIQNTVEYLLSTYDRFDVAKVYILYRQSKDEARILLKTTNYNQLLTDNFINKYKHKKPPFTSLGEFVYLRTYSRWLTEENRREKWYETVRRAVEYNCSLTKTTRQEAEELYDNIFHLKQFLSGRTFFIGGTEVSYKYPLSNFNCSFCVVDKFTAFTNIFYLLMLGSGCGFRILKEDVDKLPALKTNVEIIQKSYSPVKKTERHEHTNLIFSKNKVEIVIGDSKGGWKKALEYYFNILYDIEYDSIDMIVLNYDNVRPRGEPLKTFGGTASGYKTLESMFNKIHNVIISDKSSIKRQLTTLNCLDIINIIGENVVCGGVRRTAEIGLFEYSDSDIRTAKTNLYKKVVDVDGNEKWDIDESIIHRSLSNNSIFYKEKPSRDFLHKQIMEMRYSGEPGFINASEGSRRRSNFKGVNPCVEVLLDDCGVCNLVTQNILAYVVDGILDTINLIKDIRLSARAAYRMTLPTLELPEFNATQKQDRLVGCSLTGYQDAINSLKYTTQQEIELLSLLRKTVHDAVNSYACELGLNSPLLSTTVKPEGTLSCLPSVSSGVHYSHAPYYIRRVRINSNDPLVKTVKEAGYTVLPDTGEDPDNPIREVIEFPMKAPEGKTKNDVSAIEQLENYLMFQKYYVDMNTSITITVKDNEWDDIEQFVWDKWDEIMAVSFLAKDGGFYQLPPFEACSKEEYEERLSKIKPISYNILNKYDVELRRKNEFIIDNLVDEECASGGCPIR